MLIRSGLLAVLAATVTACQPNAPFVSNDGRFSVAMPEDPKHDERVVDPADPTRLHSFTAAEGSTVFIVVYADIPIDGRSSADVLDGGRDNAVAKPGRSLLAERPVSLGAHPGRELEVSDATGQFVCVRLFLVGSRLYQVLVAGPDEALVREKSRPFFESFAVL